MLIYKIIFVLVFAAILYIWFKFYGQPINKIDGYLKQFMDLGYKTRYSRFTFLSLESVRNI